MAGLRRLDRDIGGLEIADFADHDDIGILAQECAERRGKGETSLLVQVDLIDARELDFRRILRRRDVDAWLVEDVEAGILRYSLAAARGTGDQDHSIRALDRTQQELLLVGLVSKRLDTQLCAGGIENPQHELFAVERRQRAHAEIDRAILRQDQLHPAVLRHALFRNVELGDHLDPGGHLVLDRQRRLRDFH